MGSFALGCRIYLLGGEVDSESGDYTQIISNEVYFFDTAAAVSSSSPLYVAPPMQGAKRSPLAIHVHGMVFVISDMPSLDTYYSD